MRRQFSLPESDVAYLDSTGMKWEAVVEQGVRRAVIYAFPLPAGYDQTHADLNFRIDGAYPDTQIDMVYFFPALKRSDNISIRALAFDNFDGKTWQRWSRHRTPQNPWIAGVDDISSQLLLVEHWLEREFKKGR